MDELRRGATVQLPHGVLAMTAIGAAPTVTAAHTDEHRLAAGYSEVRRGQFLAGRWCLRRAAAEVLPAERALPPLLVDHRGAPMLPAGLTGSVSHKDSHAVGMVAPLAVDGWRVGIDLERAAPPRGDVASRILTDAELTALSGLAPFERGRAVTLRFSIKEAIYKALDPMVQRYIGFREVALQWQDQQVMVAPLRLDGTWFTVEVWWTEFDGFWLSTARARRG